MSTLTIHISEELAARIRDAAALRNVGEDELVTAVLKESFPARARIENGRRTLPVDHLFASGDGTLSARVDEILAESWADAIAGDR